METNATALFDKAIQKLRAANDELCRPEEDVVSPVVCKNSQEAIANYLKGFLLTKGITPSEGASIEGLYKKCRSINSHFEKIDLAGHECDVHVESRFCNGAETQSRCYNIADSLDAFLREEHIIQ
jgi:HEPN domain-containing protein